MISMRDASWDMCLEDKLIPQVPASSIIDGYSLTLVSADD